MEKNEYDINNYTDQECFDILDLDSPTDRELEMKILQFMDKYEEKSKRLYSFFESMYDRFFLDESEDDDAVEGFENAYIARDDRTDTLDASAKNLGNTNAKASTQVIGNAPLRIRLLRLQIRLIVHLLQLRRLIMLLL